MSQASFAATCIKAYCQVNWPDDVEGMCKTVASDWCDRFEGFEYSCTHKYIQDLDEINKAIGAREGSGVFGAAKYKDGSRLLFTCENGIPVIDERGLTL